MNSLSKIALKYKQIPIEAKASFWYAVCSIMQKGIALLTVPIFTRILTTAEYGETSIYTSWLSIITIFTTLNLQYGSFNIAMTKFEEKRDEYISSIEGICIFLTFIALLFFLIAPSYWSGVFDLSIVLLILMLLEILATATINFWSGKKRFENKYQLLIVVTLLLSILSPIISLSLIHCLNVKKSFLKILGHAITYLIIGTILLFINFRKGKRLFNKEYWSFALKFNIPLIPYYFSQIIFNQSDRIMIQKMVGFDEAGMYSVVYSLALILSFVINSINNSYVPWVYKSIKKDDLKPISRITTMILLLIVLLLFWLILFSPEIIKIYAGKKYINAMNVVPPVAASQLFLFLSQICINIMFYYEDKYSLVKGSILSAILNIFLNFLLIPKFGYIAAGYTTLFSYIIFYLSNFYYMKKVWNKYNDKSIPYNVKLINKISFIFLFSSLIVGGLYDYFVYRITIFVCLVVLFIIFGLMIRKNMKGNIR